ncbi:MAG: ArsA family ATPase [Calothrix sp. SM1_5_4]|nr:ArsA family ATPase [Calothrix sp. SM1_5_4]
MIDLLKKHKVLVCAGTGGVGKTSMSASLGVLAAREGLRTLVLTIDPAHRLAQALGIESRPGDYVHVDGVTVLARR